MNLGRSKDLVSSEMLRGLGSAVLLMEKIICFRRRAIKNFSNLPNNGGPTVATGCCLFPIVVSSSVFRLCFLRRMLTMVLGKRKELRPILPSTVQLTSVCFDSMAHGDSA